MVERIDADARVRHLKRDALFSGHAGGHAYRSLRSELQRVRDEIPQDLRDLPFIARELRNICRVRNDELDVFRAWQRAHGPAQRREEVLDREHLRAQRDLSRLDLREIQDVIDECAERLGTRTNEADLHQLLLGQITVDALQQQPR